MTDTIQPKLNTSFWSLKINSLEHAIELINATAWLYLIYGTIFSIIALLISGLGGGLIDGLLMIFLGSFLFLKRNTWAASFVLVSGALIVLNTLINKVSGKVGGTNIFLAIIVLWSAIQSFKSVRYIKKSEKVDGSVLDKALVTKKYRKVFLTVAWISAIALSGTLYFDYFYRISSETVVSDPSGTLFTDTKFGYSLKFPPGWSLKHFLNAGNIGAINQKDSNSSILVSYKDSTKITTQAELLSFVKDDAAYGEANQNIKTISIQPIESEQYYKVLWKLQKSNGTLSDAYYITPKAADPSLRIFIWFIEVSSASEQVLNGTDVDNALKSFKLI